MKAELADRATGSIRLGVLSDPHLAHPRTPDSRFNNPVRRGRSRELFEQALDKLAPEVDALVLLGDLADAATPDDYDFLFDRLRQTRLTSFLIPGNHDLSSDAANCESGLESALGTRHQARLLIPDSGGLEVPPVRIAAARLHASGDRMYRVDGLPGTAPPEATPTLLVWLSHFPALDIRASIEQAGWTYAGDIVNRDELLSYLRRRPGPVLVLAGHLHVRSHAKAGNVLQLNLAALAESPHDATIITISASGGHIDVHRTCHSFDQTGDVRSAIIDPAQTRFHWNGSEWNRQ